MVAVRLSGVVAARPSQARVLVGAIAQLGERLNGIQEVGGSTPPGSTKQRFENRICF